MRGARAHQLTRTSAHLLFAFLIWPLLTVAGTAIALTWVPYVTIAPLTALAAAAAGTALSYGDLALCGSLVFGCSWLVFNTFGGGADGARLLLEPLTMLVAVIAGTSVWYPAVFSHPLLYPLSGLPVALLAALLALGVVMTARRLAPAGRRGRLAAVLLVAGAAAPLPIQARGALGVDGARPGLVLLGVDSVSQADDLRQFREWTAARGGTWYDRAVTPGLLTNAVWSSILAGRPVRDHGIFHTFQTPPAGAGGLLAEARAKGYQSISYFPDQLTCSVGSRAGFDEDRSGPIGWRQMLLPITANNSFLIPIIKPALPSAWPSPTQSNQAGTFTYDLRRQVREILNAGFPGQNTLVAAHLTYPHLQAYPAMADLSWEERWRVAVAPAVLVQDESLDWQHLDGPDDPLPLRRWKVARLLSVISDEADRSGYLRGGGQLVVFSDHGDRFALTTESFGEPRYHHVLLTTFGLPPRCPEAPRSLIDIGTLAGFGEGQAEPAVEFTIAPQGAWPVLMDTARLRWEGDVELDASLLLDMSGRLRRQVPWGQGSGACGPPRVR